MMKSVCLHLRWGGRVWLVLAAIVSASASAQPDPPPPTTPAEEEEETQAPSDTDALATRLDELDEAVEELEEALEEAKQWKPGFHRVMFSGHIRMGYTHRAGDDELGKELQTRRALPGRSFQVVAPCRSSQRDSRFQPL